MFSAFQYHLNPAWDNYKAFLKIILIDRFSSLWDHRIYHYLDNVTNKDANPTESATANVKETAKNVPITEITTEK